LTDQVQNQNDQVLTLKLTVNQVNTIIAGLEELPHKFSRKILDEIQQQAVPQLQVPQQSNEPTDVMPKS
jgi:hypothetical protein